MKNLGRLLFRYHIFLAFLAIQGLCIFLVVRNNNYQRASYINSTSTVVGQLYDVRDQLSGYIQLRETNDQLKAENARLRALIIENYDRFDDSTIKVNDTLYFQLYEFLPAKVINLSLNSRNNYLTLNKGRQEGIEPGMGVIAQGQAVGFVKDVSNRYSTVIPVINSNFEASIKLKNSRDLGRLVWEDLNPSYARVFEIPNHVPLAIGDTVVSSGFGNYFPKNTLVGVVDTYSQPEGENFYEIRIKLFTDFYKIEYVDVVKSLNKEEQIKLEEQLEP
ncbi:MAG: rod shape-determining protein MreC [Flavobacteriales bacterium]|nr:rod shape-determining protein MreC [Flavobacteriales bacterium]